MTKKGTSALDVRHRRLRKKIAGTPERPRLAVHFSGRNIVAQVIDDEAGKTLVSVNTTEISFQGTKTGANFSTAVRIGRLVAERAKANSVKRVVFDRGGLRYHGKVKALADAAREGGLEF